MNSKDMSMTSQRLVLLGNFLFGIANTMIFLGVTWGLVDFGRNGQLVAGALLISAILTILSSKKVATLIQKNSVLVILRINVLVIFGFVLVDLLLLETHVFLEVCISFLLLVSVYFVYSIQNPSIISYGQRVLDKNEYIPFTKKWEIQIQLATITGAGCKAFFAYYKLNNTSIYVALFCLFLSFICFYRSGTDKPSRQYQTNKDNRVGWRSLVVEHKPVMLILTLTFLPVLIVLTGNYIWPVYIHQTFENEYVFNASMWAFSSGAFIGTIYLGRVFDKFKQMNAILLSFFVFGLAFCILVVTKNLIVFVGLFAVTGAGNALVKAYRNGMIMHQFDDNQCPACNTLFNMIRSIFQIALLLTMTVFAESIGIVTLLYFFAGLCIVVGILFLMTLGLYHKIPDTSGLQLLKVRELQKTE